MKPILDWLVSIGGSPIDVLLMGIIIAGFVMQWNQKRIWNAEIKDLTYKYDTLNTNVFSIDKHTGHNGFKRGNSQGDFMLDWDGKPEKLVTVNMFNEWIARLKKKQIDDSKNIPKNTEA